VTFFPGQLYVLVPAGAMRRAQPQKSLFRQSDINKKQLTVILCT